MEEAPWPFAVLLIKYTHSLLKPLGKGPREHSLDTQKHRRRQQLSVCLLSRPRYYYSHLHILTNHQYVITSFEQDIAPDPNPSTPGLHRCQRPGNQQYATTQRDGHIGLRGRLDARVLAVRPLYVGDGPGSKRRLGAATHPVSHAGQLRHVSSRLDGGTTPVTAHAVRRLYDGQGTHHAAERQRHVRGQRWREGLHDRVGRHLRR